MNRRAIIIILVSLVAVIAAVGVIFYMRSLKTVHFDIKREGISVAIYQENTKLASLTKSGDLKLQSGDYFATIEGKNYDDTPIGFTVKESNMTVTVDPSYSSAYRESILTVELPKIKEALVRAYPSVISNFTIDRGAIYGEGDWYGTTLTEHTAFADEQGDTYRTVLQKENGSWVIKAKPALILTVHDYPNIPVEILRSVNAK